MLSDLVEHESGQEIEGMSKQQWRAMRERVRTLDITTEGEINRTGGNTTFYRIVSHWSATLVLRNQTILLSASESRGNS